MAEQFLIRVRAKTKTVYGHKRRWAYICHYTDGPGSAVVNNFKGCAKRFAAIDVPRVIAELEFRSPGHEVESIPAGATTEPTDGSMTDSERIDRLEAAIRDEGKSGGHGLVVLGAWWGAKVDTTDEPDGFSAGVGEMLLDGAEYPSLREAIDAALEGRA